MKLYYTISEVSKLIGVKPHILRYWESELPQLKPRRRGGKRYYSRDDIKKIIVLHYLIRKEGFTLQGAKKKMRDEGVDSLLPFAVTSLVGDINEEITLILNELREIVRKLGEK